MARFAVRRKSAWTSILLEMDFSKGDMPLGRGERDREEGSAVFVGPPPKARRRGKVVPRAAAAAARIVLPGEGAKAAARGGHTAAEMATAAMTK
jgi:hypothetical protein